MPSLDALRSVGIEFEWLSDGRVESEALFRLFATHQDLYVGCMKAIQNIPAIFKIGTSDVLLDSVRELGLESPVFSTRPVVMLNSERTATGTAHWKTPVHQDWRSIQGSLNCVVAWTPLIDVAQDLGPVEFILGSHKRGLFSTEKDDWYQHVQDRHFNEEEFVPALIGVGDVAIFSAFLIHRSGTNRSNDIRHSLQFRFNDLAEPSFVDRGFPDPYIYSPQPDLITPNFPTSAKMAEMFGSSESSLKAGPAK